MPDPQALNTVPVLSRKKVAKQRKRYWRWRLPTTVLRWSGGTTPCADDPNFPEFSVAIIAIRGRFHRWSRILIRSLRQTGDYHGPIYVITEKPQAFADLDNVATIKVARTRHQMVAKTCKTFLCDWVPHKRILYVDADIVIGKRIKPWFDQAVTLQKQHPTLCYPDPGDRNLPYHSGLMLIDRQQSRPLLKHWRQLLTGGRFRQDQEALLTIAQDYAVGDMPENGILFPDEAAIEQGKRDCFIHITRHRYNMLGHEKLRYYLEEVLGISNAESRLDFS